MNLIEVSSPLLQSDLRLLTRGRLVLSISSVSNPESLRLSGSVITKATCELFQTILNSPSSDRSVTTDTSGLAWLFLNNAGALVYNVQVEDLHEQQKPVAITLVDITTKRKTELEDLTPYFVNGWANGTMEKLSPRVLEPLYSGNLAVNVATQSDGSLIRGRLTAKMVADARDAPAPMLLKMIDNHSLPSTAVGLAWINVDNECHVQYDVTLSGLTIAEKQMELYIEYLPMVAPGAPVISRLLDEFHTLTIEGSPTETLPREELARLDTGVVYIKVKEKFSGATLMSTVLKQVSPQFA